MTNLTIRSIQFFGINTAIIALATMVGYIFNIPMLYCWFNIGPDMPINSSMALFLTGISIVLIGKVLKNNY